MRATRSAAARSAARGSQVRSTRRDATRVVVRGAATTAPARRPVTSPAKVVQRASGTGVNGSPRPMSGSANGAAKARLTSTPVPAPVIQRAPLDPRLAKYQAMLATKRTELTGNLDEVKFDTIARMGRVAEEDQAQLSHEEFISLQRNSMDYAALRLVQRALDRIASGDYGTCLECEEPISEKRLHAIPWAEYCVRCQEMYQGGYRGGDDEQDSAPRAQAW